MNETTDTELSPYRQNLSEHQSMEAQAQTLALAVKDGATYNTAAAFLLKIQDMRKRWAEFIRPAVRAAHEAHQKIKAVENQVEEPLKRGADAIKPALDRFDAAEEERRRQAQERVNRELRKQDEDARLATAEELAKSGKHAEAEAVLATSPAPEVVLPKTTTVKGITYRTKYSARVVDMARLVAMVDNKLAPLDFIQPNERVLNGIAQAMKESVEAQWREWGLELVKERIVSAGGGR
jgi:hypothetical protein